MIRANWLCVIIWIEFKCGVLSRARRIGRHDAAHTVSYILYTILYRYNLLDFICLFFSGGYLHCLDGFLSILDIFFFFSFSGVCVCRHRLRCVRCSSQSMDIGHFGRLPEPTIAATDVWLCMPFPKIVRVFAFTSSTSGLYMDSELFDDVPTIHSSFTNVLKRVFYERAASTLHPPPHSLNSFLFFFFVFYCRFWAIPPQIPRHTHAQSHTTFLVYISATIQFPK